MTDLLGGSDSPASIWHVGLGWLEIATQIGSIVGTIMTIRVARGLTGQIWFFMLFFLQLFLFVGFQGFSVVQAAMKASHSVDKGHPGRWRAICCATLQGAASREFYRGVYGECLRNDLPQHTPSALRQKMTELVWVPFGCRAFQMWMNWLVLLPSLCDDEVGLVQCGGTRVYYWTRKLQVLSAGFGATLLLVRLYLGLIDVKNTCGVSLATGLHVSVGAFIRSLKNGFSKWSLSKCLYTAAIQVLFTSGWGYANSVPLGWLMVLYMTALALSEVFFPVMS